MQSPPKPQFATWLIEQVQTGQYAGLCYVAGNKFRVPWKHNSRKDCNDEDCKIFKAWAEASGKIKDFPTDKAKWKTNFRCALNNLTKRFRMIKDNSKNTEDPHKIYEIINTEYNYEQTVDDFPNDFDMIPDIYTCPVLYNPSGIEHNLLNQLSNLDLSYSQIENQPSDESYEQHNSAVPGYYPTLQTSAALQASQNDPAQVAEEHCHQQAHVDPVLPSPPQPSICDLEISIHYRKREMLKTQVSYPLLQFHYNHEAPELNAYNICFPNTDGLLDQKQVAFTDCVLNSIQRGLLLEVKETGIYACRQDMCRVFASTSDPSVAHTGPRKLPQNTMEELLSFEKYVNELKQFKENNGGSPQYTITLCFGEKFPDGIPLEKKLVVVKVVPLICRHLHEMAQLEGASSLHSSNVSLQISHNSLYDLINGVFGLPVTEEAPHF